MRASKSKIWSSVALVASAVSLSAYSAASFLFAKPAVAAPKSQNTPKSQTTPKSTIAPPAAPDKLSVSAHTQAVTDLLRRSPCTRRERTITFPTNRSFGSLIYYPPNYQERETHKECCIAQAQGTVKIKAGWVVEFWPNGEFFHHPEVLDKLPPDSIDGVRLKFLPMDDSEEGLGDASLAHINNLTKLKYLDVDRSEVSDKGLSLLTKLNDLEYLSGLGSGIEGTCLKTMGHMKKMQIFKLPNCNLRISEITYIPTNFPNLRFLCLNRTRLKDESIEPISRCKNLIRIDISDNSFLTDACCKYIARLPNLYMIEMSSTSITAKGVRELAGLPLANIVVNGSIKKEELESLKKLWPKSTVVGHNPGDENKYTNDVKKILAPISRQRGL